MTFLDHIDEPLVVAAIRDAESRTRGEIRVHITEAPAPPSFDVDAAAKAAFDRLGMARTVERNGVLIYVAAAARKFEVLGDAGIHALVGEAFWDGVASRLGERFREGRFTAGLVEAVRAVGDALARHFPARDGRGDVNELSNEVSRG